MRKLTIVFALLTLLTATSIWAQAKPVCSLLTASEVATVGATGRGTEDSLPIDDGPTKGDTIKLCNWQMGAGKLSLSIARMPPGVSRAALIGQLDRGYAALKAQGWKEEKKDFGNIFCSLMTPPVVRQDAPTTTGCLIPTKGLVVSIATLGKTRVPMERAKALVESALRRL